MLSKYYLVILKSFEFNIIINYFIHFLYINLKIKSHLLFYSYFFVHNLKINTFYSEWSNNLKL